MDAQVKKQLEADSDGLLTYEYIANHIDTLSSESLEWLAGNILNVDRSGQFAASAARYLAAIDRSLYAPVIARLAGGVIDRDREHRYLAQLMEGIYGTDYRQLHGTLAAVDDVYRRLYKRLHPASVI